MVIHQFWIFALASFLLNITPGNDMIYIASRSAGQGIKAGIISSLGIMCGCLVHVIAAVAGISAIISQSALAFNTIKYAGAVYLIYLGVKSLTGKASSFDLNNNVRTVSYRKIFWQGVLTNVLNPKVALFFLAFLPQFIELSSPHPQLQITLMGLWFDFSGTVVNIFVALLFGKLGNWMAGSPGFIKIQQKITGVLLIGLGIKVAINSKN